MNYVKKFLLQARVCWLLLCLCRLFCIFEMSGFEPESCHSKQARYQLSHPSPLLSHQSPYLASYLPI
jgi:hypothetical protein